MPSREPRVALANRKPLRPHPAAPPAPASERSPQIENVRDESGLVMFCVRVAPALRRRVKLAAVGSGHTIQQLTVEALEDACARFDV
jgi:hypothetical protein